MYERLNKKGTVQYCKVQYVHSTYSRVLEVLQTRNNYFFGTVGVLSSHVEEGAKAPKKE